MPRKKEADTKSGGEDPRAHLSRELFYERLPQERVETDLAKGEKLSDLAPQARCMKAARAYKGQLTRASRKLVSTATYRTTLDQHEG